MRRIVTAFGIVALIVPLLSQSAVAAVDTTKPTLNLPASATFVVGTSIDLMEDYNGDGWGPTYGIQMRTSWTASDASGICGYRYRGNYGGYTGSWTAWGSQTSITSSETDYTNQRGGGFYDLYAYTVQVRDCAGNLTKKQVAFDPLVLQQDGQTFSDGSMVTSYSGSWTVNNCLCWSGRTTARTSQAGASATFSEIEHWGDVPPYYVALVMEKAPDRGKVAVYIDTEQVAVIDTYAATKQHRAVVWVGRWPAGSGHTLTVVNQAAPGRPRIDLDAVLAN